MGIAFQTDARTANKRLHAIAAEVVTMRTVSHSSFVWAGSYRLSKRIYLDL